MDVGVLLHVRFLVEPLAAVLTWVGPRVRVDEQVGGQGGRALECLSAHFTLKTPLLWTGKSHGQWISLTADFKSSNAL